MALAGFQLRIKALTLEAAVFLATTGFLESTSESDSSSLLLSITVAFPLFPFFVASAALALTTFAGFLAVTFACGKSNLAFHCFQFTKHLQKNLVEKMRKRRKVGLVISNELSSALKEGR